MVDEERHRRCSFGFQGSLPDLVNCSEWTQTMSGLYSMQSLLVWIADCIISAVPNYQTHWKAGQIVGGAETEMDRGIWH